MNCPKHLKHKPIIAVNDYHLIDACSYDAMALSVGKAQWNNDDFSAKIFRYDFNNSKWARESEEMPIPRLLDLAELVIAIINGKSSSLNEQVVDNASYADLMNYINTNRAMLSQKIDNIKKLV